MSAAIAHPYIDIDVHPLVGNLKELFGYLPGAWVTRFEREGFGRGVSGDSRTVRFFHPHGSPIRSDAAPPGGGAPGSDPEFVREHYLDRYRPERVVLIPLRESGWSTWADLDAMGVVYSATNDFYLERWLPLDSRYTHAMLVVGQDPAQAVAEIRRIGDRDQVSGIFLPLFDRLLGDRHFYPIYDVAQEYDLPIVIHPTAGIGIFHGGPPLAGGMPASYLEHYCDLGQVGWANLTSLVFEGVFERFPKLRVAFVELGFTWVLSCLWRMDTAWRGLRAAAPWVKRPPSAYVYEHMVFATQPLEEPEDGKVFLDFLRMMQAERLLAFSTDYPHWDNDVPDRVLSGLTPEERHRIFYANAAAMFRLPAPVAAPAP